MTRRLAGLLLIACLCACTGDAGDPTPAPTPPPTPTPVHRELAAMRITVGSGDTFGSLAQRAGVPWGDQQELVAASEEEWNLVRSLRPGDTLDFTHDVTEEGRILVGLSVQRKADVRLQLGRDENGAWATDWVRPEFEVREQVFDGTIESSLWLDARKAGLDAGTIADIITIFDWQVDFFAVQPGDRFRVVMEARYLDGAFRGYGNVLGGRFQRGTKNAYAIRFTPPDAAAGYYDEDGGSNRRMFLASPLDYARISSHFTKARYHPVLHKWRSHKGTDYAAGTGTPIRAIGDGTVVYAGTKGGYGKHVRIRHRKPYESSYSHMSRISVKVGQQVEQGQTVGKVGSTGMSTGPHLHYEFYKGKSQVNWVKQEFPSAEPLEDEVKPLYWPVRDGMLQRLEDASFPKSNSGDTVKDSGK